MRLRVFSNPASSGSAVDESPGCPASSLFRQRLGMSLRFPRILHLPVVPQVSFQVALNPRSFGCPGGWVSELPRISHPSAVPHLKSPGCPESCICGWVDDDSPPRLELCIPGLAADESSCPIGSCTFPSDSGRFLNLYPAFHRRTSRLCTAEFNRVPHLFARLELRFQFPTGSPTGTESRTDRSVEASAKRR
jgi:hypothetical protein